MRSAPSNAYCLPITCRAPASARPTLPRRRRCGRDRFGTGRGIVIGASLPGSLGPSPAAPAAARTLAPPSSLSNVLGLVDGDCSGSGSRGNSGVVRLHSLSAVPSLPAAASYHTCSPPGDPTTDAPRERSSSSSSSPKTICCKTSSTLKTPPDACQSSWMMFRTRRRQPQSVAKRSDCSSRMLTVGTSFSSESPAVPAPSSGNAKSSSAASK
mmetsp:Transcript_47081/g.123545  ORF Transcript_47081/g.123545 Transcript_47081/m.123545 type:complete len:212 (-) Transcript_47081:476-1111(-)